MSNRFQTLSGSAPEHDQPAKSGKGSKDNLVRAFDRPILGRKTPPDLPAGLPAIIHCLSQPLTALHGSLELSLLTEHSVAEYRSALEESLAQADYMFSLLGRLRELVAAKETSEPAEIVSLDELLKEMVDKLRPLADSRSLKVSVRSAGKCRVRADPMKLSEAVLKVLDRAINRAPDSGTVRISVSGDDTQVVFEITDDGPPPDSGELERLFRSRSLGEMFAEAFKRGTLEWATAKLIFETQGGLVQVAEKPGKGCLFRVCFPCQSPDPSIT